MSDLIGQGLALQRVSRYLTSYVSVILNMAGGEQEYEAEVVYTRIPAFDGMPDEPPYGEHIEIHSCSILYTALGQKRKVDITELVNHDDKLFDAIQLEIIGD